MNIFVYSDESGVMDNQHEDYFIFAGLVFLDKNQRDERIRMYLNAESAIRKKTKCSDTEELKATRISNKNKGKLLRSLNADNKFAFVVNLNRVNGSVFQSKKHKQRFLDYVFKVGLKKHLEYLIKQGQILPSEVEHIYIFVDEHTTATNGIYELREGIENELKIGTFNMDYNLFYPPIFPRMGSLQLKYCNSCKVTLIRAADIVANRVYWMAKDNLLDEIDHKIHIIKFP